MTDRDSPPAPPSPTQRRRSSFSAQVMADLFTSRPSISQQNGNKDNDKQSAPPSAYPGPITSAAAQAQRRRLSLTTLGLSGSPNQTSPFQSGRSRGESLSSATSGSVDESPFEDDSAAPSGNGGQPNTPFARRLSFGARALRDVRTGSGSGNANGEGFNFADNLRSRAERSSISTQGMAAQPSQPAHHRAKSVASMEPPAREMPKPKAPDAFQERILKGDFYMD